MADYLLWPALAVAAAAILLFFVLAGTPRAPRCSPASPGRAGASSSAPRKEPTMDAALQERAITDRRLEAAREAFLADPASLTIYTKSSGERALRGRVHGRLDDRLKAAIAAYLAQG